MNRRQLLAHLSVVPLAALLPGCGARRSTSTPAVGEALALDPAVAAQVLIPGVRVDLDTFRTLGSLQRHTEWVSQSAARVPGLLESAGFALIDGVIKPEGSGGQGYVASRGADVVVSFRGSEGDTPAGTARNIVDDVGVPRVRPEALVEDPGDARVHDGFYRSYLKFRDAIHQRVSQVPDANVYVTGFSLGSAIAAFCAFDLSANLGRAVSAHMLGTPRTGNLAWGALWTQRVPAGLRLTLEPDPVPRVPAHMDDAQGFNHLAGLLNLNFDGTVVPRDQIDGRLRSKGDEEDNFKAHDRDKYLAALTAFLSHFAAGEAFTDTGLGEDPLRGAAAAEAESVGRT